MQLLFQGSCMTEPQDSTVLEGTLMITCFQCPAINRVKQVLLLGLGLPTPGHRFCPQTLLLSPPEAWLLWLLMQDSEAAVT